MNKFFKNNLGLAGILVAFILLSIGLRTKFDYNFWGLPPNFMEFNMYVHTMVSAIDGANYPEIFISSDEKKLIQRERIKDTLAFNFLFQNDRWARDERLINQYFCNNAVLNKLSIEINENTQVSIEYLKNGRYPVVEMYNVECTEQI